VEALEDRFCLSAPQVTLTAVTELANRQVQVSGSVTDDSSPSVTLGFSGVISGHETVNSNTSFTFTATASGLGQITAGGMDTLNQASNTAQINFTSAAPTVTNLNYTWGANKQVTITGTVNDAFPSGLTVYVGGAPFGGGMGGSTTTGSQGNFSITLTASQLGQVVVGTTDQWGQTSAAASLKLADSTPTIANFTASQSLGHSWTFTGTVTAGYAPGLTVNFSGLPELANQKATVQADGTFSLTVTLSAKEAGYVNCAVTDWWNVTSATQSYFVVCG
jgi:hypothetical protein